MRSRSTRIGTSLYGFISAMSSGLAKTIDVADLEVHALLEEHEAAAVRVRAGGSGIKHHHGGVLLEAS